MSFRVIKGDLVELAKQNEFDVLIHGIHCFNYANSGVAKAIGTTFPEAFHADQRTIKGDRSKLGSYSYAVCHPNNQPLVIINAYTQYYFGHKHYKCPTGFDYTSFRRLFEKIKLRFHGRGLRFGFPLIGGDRGNADPHQVIGIIQEALPNESLTLVLLTEPGRKKQYKPADFALHTTKKAL